MNHLLESIIELMPHGCDDELKRLAEHVAKNNDDGKREKHYDNPTCMRLMSAVFHKLREKKNFTYRTLADIYDHEEKNKFIRQQRKDLDAVSHNKELSPAERLKAIDEKIKITTKAVFGNKHSSELKANDCIQALNICRQELPERTDLKNRYEELAEHYRGNEKRAVEYGQKRHPEKPRPKLHISSANYVEY